MISFLHIAQTLKGSCSILRKKLVFLRRISLSSPTVSLTHRWLVLSLLMKTSHALDRVSISSLFLPQTLFATLVHSMKEHEKELVALCRLAPQLDFWRILICHARTNIATKSLKRVWLFSPNHSLWQSSSFQHSTRGKNSYRSLFPRKSSFYV